MRAQRNSDLTETVIMMSRLGLPHLILFCTLPGMKSSPLHNSIYTDADLRTSPLLLLQENLLSGYSESVPLSKGGAGPPPTVYVGLAPQWMDLQENGVLSLVAWLRLGWSDPRLKWSPEQHHNISSFRMSPKGIWKPDIMVLNKQDVAYGGNAVDPRSVDSSSLHLQSNGDIVWMVPVNHKVLCEQINYEKWPWGKQTCNIKFGTYSQEYNAYDLQFYNGKSKMNLRHYGKNNQFKILRQMAFRKLTKSKHIVTSQFISLNYIFSIQRSYKVDSEKGRIENQTPSEEEQFKSMLRKLG